MNVFTQSGQWTVGAGTSPAAFLAVCFVLAMLIDRCELHRNQIANAALRRRSALYMRAASNCARAAPVMLAAQASQAYPRSAYRHGLNLHIYARYNLTTRSPCVKRHELPAYTSDLRNEPLILALRAAEVCAFYLVTVAIDIWSVRLINNAVNFVPSAPGHHLVRQHLITIPMLNPLRRPRARARYTPVAF